MRHFAVSVLLLAAVAAGVALGVEPGGGSAMLTAGGASPGFSVQLTGRLDDGPRVAYELTRTFMPEAQWQARVREFESKFGDWEKDTNGDLNRYLNDRLIIVALSAAGGEREGIQGALAYLALYDQFGQQAPSIVTNFMRDHRGSMTRLLTNFTWEKACDYVKNHRWREDLAERNRAGLAAAAPLRAVTVTAVRTTGDGGLMPGARPSSFRPLAPGPGPRAYSPGPWPRAPDPSPSQFAAWTSMTSAAATPEADPLTCLQLLSLDWYALTTAPAVTPLAAK